MLEADSPHDELLDHSLIPKPVKLSIGERIGHYQLLKQIGEGGMGYVYMAEQLEPVRRNVALKVIKPGVDTREVIARFEAERQALSIMDHPNIAKVLDAGTTATGHPFFVMELVMDCRSRTIATSISCKRHSVSSYSIRSAARSNTHIRKGSFTATSTL